MTILYKPVLIESAEQAEALPIGTVGHEPPHLYAYIKKARNYWRGTGDDAALTDYEMPPFTALVPIEAEEETHSIQTRGQTTPEWRTRLATQEPTDAEIEAGMTAAAQSMPAAWWGGTEWRRYVEEILAAARAVGRDAR